MDQMSLAYSKQVPTECWWCKTKSGVQIVMNGIILKAVHHQDHAQLLISQLELGRIGRVRDIYELVPATVPLSEQESQPLE